MRAVHEGGKVRLRDVEPDDLPIYFENQRDPVAVEMAAFPARDQEAFTAHWMKILADELKHHEDRPAGRRRGRQPGEWRDDEGHREAGYWLGRSFWGKGVATAALALFVAEVDERPLSAHVATQNVGSRRVLERCGFKVMGGPSEPTKTASANCSWSSVATSTGRRLPHEVRA